MIRLSGVAVLLKGLRGYDSCVDTRESFGWLRRWEQPGVIPTAAITLLSALLTGQISRAVDTPEWKHLVAGMESVKAFAPQPWKSPVEPSSPSGPQEPMGKDFGERFDTFLKEWLMDRDVAKVWIFCLDLHSGPAPSQGLA